MQHSDLINKLQANEKVSFDDALHVINDNYDYQATAFKNGDLDNAAGTNEGSCKIFAFALLNDLTAEQTLSLFGNYYWQDVLQDPEGSGHQNIRHFIAHGWLGIHFKGVALTAK